MREGGEREPIRVLHIIPEYGTGGAEVAALSAAGANHGQVRVLFLSAPAGTPLDAGVELCEGCHPLGATAVRLAARVVRRDRPDVAVVSLWKSLATLLALRFLPERPLLVHLLHADRPKHVFDQLAHFMMLRACDAVWADSVTTLDARYPPNRRSKPTRVVSFLVRRISAEPRHTPRPSFIFWGRLAPQKQIERSIDLFARVARQDPSAVFRIIGRDDGSQASAEARARSLGVAGQIAFLGELPFDEIRRLAADASFYLQTSSFEGMAMSVVEAMQLGLVPVVTPVGEIARYCNHLGNAVVFRGSDETEGDLRTILTNPLEYARLSAAAIDTWSDVALYRDDIVAAARELLMHPPLQRRRNPPRSGIAQETRSEGTP